MAAYDDPAVMAVGGVARPVWPDRSARPPAAGAGLAGRLHLPGPAHRARRRAQPVGLQHVGAAVPVRGDRRLRRGRRTDRADPARCRGDRVLHPDRPAEARQPGWSSSPRARGAPPGDRGPDRVGPTCGPARTPRASRRRPWPGWSAPTDATSEESRYVSKVLTAGLRRELGRGMRGRRAGFGRAPRASSPASARPASGTPAGGWATGPKVNAVALERRGAARDRAHEDPRARAVLPAGDRRRGAPRAQPLRRAGLPRARRARRLSRTSASRRQSTRA